MWFCPKTILLIHSFINWKTSGWCPSLLVSVATVSTTNLLARINNTTFCCGTLKQSDSESQEVQAAEVLCVLFLKRHTIIFVFIVLCCIVLWYTLLVLCAVWLWAMSCAEAASESHYCVWLTVVDETIAFKLRKSKDWLWFRYLC